MKSCRKIKGPIYKRKEYSTGRRLVGKSRPGRGSKKQWETKQSHGGGERSKRMVRNRNTSGWGGPGCVVGCFTNDGGVAKKVGGLGRKSGLRNFQDRGFFRGRDGKKGVRNHWNRQQGKEVGGGRVCVPIFGHQSVFL